MSALIFSIFCSVAVFGGIGVDAYRRARERRLVKAEREANR